jgi:hypothetical protein
MSRSRAMRTAFATLFREPAVLLAEFVARWVLILISACLAFYAFIAYVRSLPVSDADLLGLSGIIPGAALAAIKHIFAGSGPMLVRLAIAVALSICLLWWAVTSASRSVTAAELLGHDKPRFFPTSAANALRVLIAVCTFIVDVGIFLFAARQAVLSPMEVDAGKLYAIAVPLWLLTGMFYSVASWYLSLVPYAENKTLRGSLEAASVVTRAAGSQFAWIGFVLGCLRFACVFFGIFAFFFAIGLIGQLPAIMAWLVLVLCAVVFAAISSILQLLRAAAYARVFVWHRETQQKQAFAAVR